MYQYFLQCNERPLYLTGEHSILQQNGKKQKAWLPIVPVMLEENWAWSLKFSFVGLPYCLMYFD